jgi:hypothetical protein
VGYLAGGIVDMIVSAMVGTGSVVVRMAGEPVIKFAGHRTELATRQRCAPWAKCSAMQQGRNRVAKRFHSGPGGTARLGQPPGDHRLDDL